MTKKKNTKPKQKAKTSHAIDLSKLSLAIKKALKGFTDETGEKYAGVDEALASLKKITYVLNNKETRNANNIIKVFGKTFDQWRDITPEKTLTIQDMEILISNLKNASKYVSANATGFLSKELYQQNEEYPKYLLDALSERLLSLLVDVNKISCFFFHKDIMDFLNKFKNGIFVDNQITVTKYEYAVSDYSPEKPEIYREVLERIIEIPNKNSQSEYKVIIILGLYSEIEEDFSTVKEIFFKSIKTKGISDDFKNGCLIKYARYLLENKRPQETISKVIDLITDLDLKGLIIDLYKFYFASDPADIDSLKFPDPNKTSQIISYALYTEHLIAVVESLNGETETRKCLSYFRQQKDEILDTRHLLSKSTKNYVESKILEACIHFLPIKDCIKILESDLCNPLSEDASLVFKTNAIWLYILAGDTEKANEIEATLPGAEIKSEPANLEESTAEPAPAESLQQVEVASSYFPQASKMHKEQKKTEEESFVVPKPLKKVKFTSIDAARIENTPDKNLTPEEQHKYYSYKKKMALIEATTKIDQAEHADKSKVSGWFVKGKQFDKDIDSGIYHLGNNTYAVISDEISLEEITMNQFKNALTKGFTRREKGENGVKFVEKSVIELKISSESRLFTEKKYMNSNNEYLIIFDRMGNHAEVKKLAHENSFMMEIYADLADLKSESVSDTHSPYTEDHLSVIKDVEAAGETSEYNVCDPYT